jgi:hypothetical protein
MFFSERNGKSWNEKKEWLVSRVWIGFVDMFIKKATTMKPRG